ncbi:MAG TPA: hypothetical protein VMZ52_10110 [Bryobacteraceae bacterium]|nr:hypothetical protein [Bryobacteraceae bacterium]
MEPTITSHAGMPAGCGGASYEYAVGRGGGSGWRSGCRGGSWGGGGGGAATGGGATGSGAEGTGWGGFTGGGGGVAAALAAQLGHSAYAGGTSLLHLGQIHVNMTTLHFDYDPHPGGSQ